MTSSDTPVVAVVVAAGSGSRLGAAVPKALVRLDGVALVRRSVDALVAAGVQRVVVTIPDGMDAQFRSALMGVPVPVHCLAGGATRQDSVRIAVAALYAPDEAVVLVHDAARALVPADVIRRVADAVGSGAQAAIPVLPVVDSIRRVRPGGSETVDRADLRVVQTPQGARLGALRAAHARCAEIGAEVTDDAAACEVAGMTVTMVEGHRDALKITEPIDLILAEAILAERNRP